MAQSAEDASAEDGTIDLEYYCHNCDQVVSDIEYAEDGTIKCTICNEQYVEIIDSEDQMEDTNNNQSNTNPNNNNANANTNANANANANANQNRSFQNANGQFFYFSSHNNNGQPLRMGFGSNNVQSMPNIGQILNGVFPNMSNANQAQNQRVNQRMNQGFAQGMNMMQGMFNMGNNGGFGNIIQQMVDPMHNGPPPTNQTIINTLPEYEYNGPNPVKSDSENESENEIIKPSPPSSNEDKDSDLISDTSHTIISDKTANETETEKKKELECKEESDEKNRECAVCKEKFCKGDLLKELPCHHRYHKDCIMPWLTRRNTCPTCRHRLATDNPYYDQMQNARARQQNNNGNSPNNANNGNNGNGMPPFNVFFNQFFAPPPQRQNNNNPSNNQ